MQKKALTLAGCIALATPTISIAQALPNNLVGLDLGEINAASSLNQPFDGSIPFLFTSADDANALTVKLAPASVFQKIGAEKLAVLDALQFDVVVQAGKPVIKIRSDVPINLPFLNIVLEIGTPKGVSYQDFTVLLDPPEYNSIPVAKTPVPNHRQANNIANTALFLETYSSPAISTQTDKTYTVKAGDSLSKIAKKIKTEKSSLADMLQALYEKNPKAFIKADINKIKRGAVLNLPTAEELSGAAKIVKNTAPKIKQAPTTKRVDAKQTVLESSKTQYTVKKGDSLFKVTRKFVEQGESFTKTMNAIFQANPDAFSKGRKHLLKAGATLDIPTLTNPSEQTVANNQTETVEKTAVKEPEISSIETSKTASIEKDTTSVDTSESQTATSSNTTNADKKVEGYVVKKGDTLSSIVKSLEDPVASITKTMKSLFVANPQAFVSNNITRLKEGAVLDLSVIKTGTEQNQNVVKDSSVLVNNTKKPEVTTAKNFSKLEKRIRELRSELNNTKTSLNELEATLEEKDELIIEKDQMLVDLKSSLVKLRRDGYKSAEQNGSLYGIDKKEEIEKMATLALAGKNIDAKEGFNAKLYAFLRNTFDESNAKNLSYGALALLLGLFLLRYRREIYSYTAISFDHPKYYPAPDAKDNLEKYPLKEKNINYSDYLIDSEEDAENQQVESNKEEEWVESVESVEAEETEEVEHCEHLVTELFEDLDQPEDITNISTEWKSIEKVCDTYIETVKEKNDLERTLNSTTQTTEEQKGEDSGVKVADFEVMMNDLLSSLNDVEETISKNGMDEETKTAEEKELDESVEEALAVFEEYQSKAN